MREAEQHRTNRVGWLRAAVLGASRCGRGADCTACSTRYDSSGKAGTPTCQVTLLTPWVGSRGHEQPFHDGFVLSKAGGQIKDFQYDGNHCLPTSDAHPWMLGFSVPGVLGCGIAFIMGIEITLAIRRSGPK